MGFRHIGQAGLTFLTSSDPPTSASQNSSVTGVTHRDQPQTISFSSPGNVKKLGETYPSISNARNAELRLRWGQIVLKNDHQEDFWKVKEFLHNQVGDPCLAVPESTPGPTRPYVK